MSPSSYAPGRSSPPLLNLTRATPSGIIVKLCEGVAQPVEHRPFKAGVLGSNPSALMESRNVRSGFFHLLEMIRHPGNGSAEDERGAIQCRSIPLQPANAMQLRGGQETRVKRSECVDMQFQLSASPLGDAPASVGYLQAISSDVFRKDIVRYLQVERTT